MRALCHAVSDALLPDVFVLEACATAPLCENVRLVNFHGGSQAGSSVMKWLQLLHCVGVATLIVPTRTLTVKSP